MIMYKGNRVQLTCKEHLDMNSPRSLVGSWELSPSLSSKAISESSPSTNLCHCPQMTYRSAFMLDEPAWYRLHTTWWFIVEQLKEAGCGLQQALSG